MWLLKSHDGRSNPNRHKAFGSRRDCPDVTGVVAAKDKPSEKNNGRKDLDKVREILTPVGWPAACQ